MDDTKAILNLGDLSKPATVLIQKISEAVGGIFKPYQIKRIAKAKAEASKIEAQTEIEISEIQQRAFLRFLNEETRKQINIEEITAKAIPKLENKSKPENIEEDWLANFFEKCRIISNEEMQNLWSRILAGEANEPGSYSKRTIDFISVLDKTEAELFSKLCSFGWLIGNITPIIFDVKDEIYSKNGLTYSDLKNLDSLGLISFESLIGFKKMGFPKKAIIFYYGTPIELEFKKEKDNELEIGKVLLTKLGQELAPISNSIRNDDFVDYALKKIFEEGVVVSSPLHKVPFNAERDL